LSKGRAADKRKANAAISSSDDDVRVHAAQSRPCTCHTRSCHERLHSHTHTHTHTRQTQAHTNIHAHTHTHTHTQAHTRTCWKASSTTRSCRTHAHTSTHAGRRPAHNAHACLFSPQARIVYSASTFLLFFEISAPLPCRAAAAVTRTRTTSGRRRSTRRRRRSTRKTRNTKRCASRFAFRILNDIEEQARSQELLPST